ncbi:MAG: hypothetical protein CGW95_04120, partial [Phenylobacterium zucineum]
MGLANSDLPGAGYGVFLRGDYPSGTRLATYSGKHITIADVNNPQYDVSYVWSDLDQAEALTARGRRPLIIDANPRFAPLDWGGMINDGLTRAANVYLHRVRDQLFVTLLTDGVSGMELYLEYGPEYWQAKYFSLPTDLRQEVAACYNLTVLGDQCFRPPEIAALRKDKRIHQENGKWCWGPPQPRANKTRTQDRR